MEAMGAQGSSAARSRAWPRSWAARVELFRNRHLGKKAHLYVWLDAIQSRAGTTPEWSPRPSSSPVVCARRANARCWESRSRRGRWPARGATSWRHGPSRAPQGARTGGVGDLVPHKRTLRFAGRRVRSWRTDRAPAAKRARVIPGPSRAPPRSPYRGCGGPCPPQEDTEDTLGSRIPGNSARTASASAESGMLRAGVRAARAIPGPSRAPPGSPYRGCGGPCPPQEDSQIRRPARPLLADRPRAGREPREGHAWTEPGSPGEAVPGVGDLVPHKTTEFP